MPFAFKTKKSAGVRVTAAVHRLIACGNTARDAGEWADAAAAYRAALEAAPGLPHIHLQHGHALKQAERPEEADAAYAEAARLAPDATEPLVHRAHLVRGLRGHRAGARLLAAGLARRPDDTVLEGELRGLTNLDVAITPAVLRQVLAALPAENEAPANPAPQAGSDAARIFDIGDLIGHFRHQRLPNGIERVQIEVITHMLDAHGDDAIRLCGFVAGRDGWVGVLPGLFRDLARLATTGGDPAAADWQQARARLFLHLALADDQAMPTGAVLLNLGTSWWAHDYFRHIRNARDRTGIRYIPLIYDLIPVLDTRYSLPGVSRDFVGWLIGALRHADGFMAISHHTRDDLLHVAERLGQPLASNRVEVIPLDADFRHAVDPLPAAALAGWGLADTPFALLVSTIEPRKNHALALDAWAALLRRHGPGKVPRLVCVGRDGWRNDPVFARLALDPLLAAHVTLISQVSDGALALLYRACRFTVYPSLYEGWGLPVTEALCHGRVAIVADNSSLPEAGGDFALMFASGSLSALVAAVEQVAFDDGWRETREAMIAARFAPRPWAAIARQIDRAVTRLLATADASTEAGGPVAAGTAPAQVISSVTPGTATPGQAVIARSVPCGTAFAVSPPDVVRGTYYPTLLHHAERLPTDPMGGEDVRVGDGWLWPEPDGCRTTPAGGTVRMCVTGNGPLRLHLRLRGLAEVACPVSIMVDGRTAAKTIIPAGKVRWLACDIAGPDCVLVLHGAAAEMVVMPNGMREASVTLLGLLPTDRDTPPATLIALIDRACRQ